MPKITAKSLMQMIDAADDKKKAHIIGRACVVLFNNQTKDEQDTDDTRHHNGIGFTGSDARTGSLTAKYYMKHNTLQDWQMAKWMKPNAKGTMRIAKYHKQLQAAAVDKARRMAEGIDQQQVRLQQREADRRAQQHREHQLAMQKAAEEARKQQQKAEELRRGLRAKLLKDLPDEVQKLIPLQLEEAEEDAIAVFGGTK